MPQTPRPASALLAALAFPFFNSLAKILIHAAHRPLSLRALILMEFNVFFHFLFIKKNAWHDLINNTLSYAVL